jgi:hypothetical protein
MSISVGLQAERIIRLQNFMKLQLYTKVYPKSMSSIYEIQLL